MNISPRHIGASIAVFLMVCAVIGLILEITFAAPTFLIMLCAAQLVVFALLCVAYWYEWHYAPFVTVVVIVVAVFLSGISVEREIGYLLVLIPPAVAMVLLEPFGLMVVIIVALGGHELFYGIQGAWPPLYITLLHVILLGSMMLGRLGTASAVQRAEANARRAEEAREHIATQRYALEVINQEQEAYIAEQRALMELVAALETPAVTLADDVILAPIVGHLDARRAGRLASQLLRQVYARRTRMVILDIAGVTMVDSQVAQALEHTARSVQLLGCEVVLSGISAQVAATLIAQHVTLDGIAVVRSPQEALAER